MTPHSDTIEDVSQAYKLYAAISVLLFCLVSTTLVRILVRLWYRGSLKSDDGFIVLGTVSTAGTI